jgi:cytochrome c biogenesis protein CcmG/thiol:disulfide interchange protein DsbE
MARISTAFRVTDRLRRARETRLGNLAVLAVVAVLVTAAAYAVDHRSAVQESGVTAVKLTGEAGTAPVVGRPAPDFTASTVDGTTISLAGLRGHPVWLTFGASWCAACRAEAPDIQAASERARAQGATVVEVFISEDAATVRSYGQRVGLTYPKVADPQTRIASQYRVLGIPAHFFIDSSGVLRTVKAGSLTGQEMDANVRAAGA